MEQRESLWKRRDGSVWTEVRIPSNNDFLKQYHQWIFKKVADEFKRNKDRMQDTVQNVRIRLLQKDFIGRWFFKHLQHELVSRDEAERILGGSVQLKFISMVSPVVGKRSEPDSLWQVSDLLRYAKFDHYRFYYSIQDHTIDSDTMLRLLGYLDLSHPDPNGKTKDAQGNRVSFNPEAYNTLKSLYKQGRIKPAELTQHLCCEQTTKASPIVGPDGETLCSVKGCGKKHWARGFCTRHYDSRTQSACPICEKGRESLHAKGVSLADNWTENAAAASEIRWLDTQLRPFLRNWQRQNIVSCVPARIVRPSNFNSPYPGIEAGLLKYAWKMIKNEVINDFKRMKRSDDASVTIFNDGVSPDADNTATVAWEMDDNGECRQMVVKDSNALGAFTAREAALDIRAIASRADLTDEERDAIVSVDLEESSARDYADKVGVSPAQLNRIRNSALEKLRCADMSEAVVDSLMIIVCRKHGCATEDLLGSSRVGPCVLARAEFFYELHKLGLSIEEIVSRTGSTRDRVLLSINRASMRALS